jgi:restriction system protein
MDVSLIIKSAWGAVWWLIPLFIILGVLPSPWGKGVLGEQLVRLQAWLRLDKETYRSVHNVTLRTPDGTTQLDHVFVSRFGIFVLETKNMRGWIFGSERQAHWTQKLYRRSFKFQNPLRQNYKHVKAMEAALTVPPETIHCVVAFVGGSTFKTPMPANVTSGGGFIRFIKSFRETVLTDKQVQDALQQIKAGRLTPTSETHRAHVRSLKTRSDPLADRRCPKCGSPLVLRTVKTGAKTGERFWGCSAFPKCRLMQPFG